MKKSTKFLVTILASTMVTFMATPVFAKTMSVQIIGEYKSADFNKVLKKINQIRKEACDKGINGLKPNNYVPVVWSTDLIKMAQKRAADLNFLFEHKRPNGSEIWTAFNSTNVNVSAENIAYNETSNTIESAVDQFYSEKELLLKGDRGSAGHYLSMINPEYNCVGIAAINGYTEMCLGNTNKSPQEIFNKNAFEPTEINTPVDSSMIKKFYLSGVKSNLKINESMEVVPFVSVKALDAFDNNIDVSGILLDSVGLQLTNKNVVSVNNNVITGKKDGSTDLIAKVDVLGSIGEKTYKINVGSGKSQGNHSNDKDQIKNSNVQPVKNQGDFIVMYRLYNPNNHEHFYTSKIEEARHLVNIGWGKFEGPAWGCEKKGKPVYRLYNPVLRDHHYTMDKNEIKALVAKHGWINEGIGWYSSGKKPVYRLFNPNLTSGSHHYTLDKNEVKVLQSRGWKFEGVAWYGYEIKVVNE